MKFSSFLGKLICKRNRIEIELLMEVEEKRTQKKSFGFWFGCSDVEPHLK